MEEAKFSNQLNKNKEDSEIIIWLNSYNDIFSSFDPRPYSKRALSANFILELRKASKVKDSSIKIRLFIPEEKRNIREEAMIKKRLGEYFKKHYEIEKISWEKARNIAMSFIAGGALSLFIVAYFNLYESINFAKILLRVLLEPAGWFFTWIGLERIFRLSSSGKNKYQFYTKMSGSEIEFLVY